MSFLRMPLFAALLFGAFVPGCSDDTTAGGTELPLSFDGLTADMESTDAIATVDLWTSDTSSEDLSTAEVTETDADPDTGDDALTDASVCDAFGCPCSSNADCLDELCIEGPDGFLCTKPCVTNCPEGYDCVNTAALGPDPISICVPRHIKLCRPCETQEDCADPFAIKPGLCLAGEASTLGSFCTSSCAFGLECPAGTTCSDTPQADGTTSQQCVPTDGTCECRDSWADLGLTTTCAIENAFGLCEGSRSCTTTGLSACSATAPGAEICNGEDDDCDGEIDNLPFSECTNDNALGSCSGQLVCGSGAEALCDADVPTVETCNGLDDDCDGVTDEATCDDGLACTQDSCTSDSICIHSPEAGFCVIDGACFSEGTANPLDPCMGCIAAANPNAWTSLEGSGCNDSDACTQSDTCVQGTCAGQLYVCNDGLNCTGDTCDGLGGCTHPIAAGYCTIEGLCWPDDTVSPSNTCHVCASAKATSSWSNILSGTDCDDGEPCTLSDKCAPGGSCTGNFQSCNDGKWCTVDTCDGFGGCTNQPDGGCLIGNTCYADGSTNPNNTCEVCNASLTKTGWSPDNGKNCSDFQSCTQGDSCQAGACVGVAYSCSDDLACTTDICDGSGGCSHTINVNKCLISGICYAGGTPNPNNPCKVCNSANKGWSNNDGASCSDGDSCTSGDTCSAGTCVANAIVDDYETNDTKNTATNIGSVDDNEDYPKGSFSATLYGTGDEDWYKFYDDDKWNGSIYPRADLKNIPVGSNYKLCAYFSCSGVSVSCKTGSSSTYGGMPGCCSNKSGNASEMVRLDNNCSGSDDSGWVYVRVTRVSGPWTCNSYSLEWGDD